MKTTKSRAGKGLPSSIVSGTDSTAASVIAPRTPASDVMAAIRKPGRAVFTPWTATRRLDIQRNSHTHTIRKTMLLSNLEWVDCRVKCGRKPGEANA
jgi:hypothetical protein